jgi:hypothetical protein
MILINLLPEEFVRQRRTPAQTFAAVGAAVTVNAVLLAWLGSLFFGTKSNVAHELEIKQADLASLKPQLDYHEDLVAENKLFESREGTLAEITTGRVNWTEKVDQLVDVINSGGEGRSGDAPRGESYLIWLNNLNVVQQVGTSGKSKSANSGGTFRAEGYSGSPNFGLVANFFEDLTRSDFANGFNPPAPPDGQVAEEDEGLIPSEIFSFTLDLQLLPPPERK